MAGGYQHKPDGTEGVGGILKQLQAQVNTIRGGAGIRSAILRGVQMVFQDEEGGNSAIFGRRETLRTGDDEVPFTAYANGSAFFDPATGDQLFQSTTYESDGLTIVQAGRASDPSALDFFAAYANSVVLSAAERTQILTGGELLITELPTTSSSGNLHIETPGTRIMRQTSGRKYKTDIADAEVDPEDVLALMGRTWVDKAKIDRDPEGDIRRNVGFIAEELDDLPSLRQFVVYDENGDPDGIEYDRLTVALLAVLKDHNQRLTSIEERLNNLEA